MRHIQKLIAAAFISTMCCAQTRPLTATFFVSQGSHLTPAIAVCASAGAYAFFTAARTGEVNATIVTYLKTRTQIHHRRYALGAADSGAGSTYQALEPKPESASVKNAYFIRFNISGYTEVTNSVVEISTEEGHLACRAGEGQRVIAITSKRTVLIAHEGDGSYSYEADSLSEDSAAPTLRLSHGTALEQGRNRAHYVFSKGPYRYDVRLELRGGSSALRVYRGGRLIGNEGLVALVYYR